MAADVQDLRIGKGIVSYQPNSTGDFIDLGFVSSFTYTPNIERTPYFSAREGIRKKVAEFITEVGATINMSIDSINGFNLSLFALGTAVTAGSDVTISGLSETNKQGTVRVVGTNDQGRLVDFQCSTQLVPAGEYEFLTQEDDINSIEVEGEVLEDETGAFGQWTIRPQDGATA